MQKKQEMSSFSYAKNKQVFYLKGVFQERQNSKSSGNQSKLSFSRGCGQLGVGSDKATGSVLHPSYTSASEKVILQLSSLAKTRKGYLPLHKAVSNKQTFSRGTLLPGDGRKSHPSIHVSSQPIFFLFAFPFASFNLKFPHSFSLTSFLRICWYRKSGLRECVVYPLFSLLFHSHFWINAQYQLGLIKDPSQICFPECNKFYEKWKLGKS